MAPDPNKLSQFWQELKRRRVHRSMAIYAGSAYVIFEASTLIFPRWGLPDWTIDLVLYLLILGAIVTLVLGWLYDLTPEGVHKTEPISETSTKEGSPTSNGWKIASYISIVVIVGLLVLNIIPRAAKREGFDKSIAVLPFDNDSPSSENTYAINGYRTAVHDNLCKIKALRVLTLQSTEQFRNQNNPISEIAKELGVGYLLSATGQIINNRIRLTVQLADANDDIIWSHPYDRQIELMEDHIDIQSDIAQLVASELETVITPEEKQLIKKNPTTSLMAYEFYQKGVEELSKYQSDYNDKTSLNRAENLFQFALDYDSSFALAYTGLAETYLEKNLINEYLNEGYLDTVLHLANAALEYDVQLADAYGLLGQYYYSLGNMEKAIEEISKALKYNPNDAYLFSWLGFLYQWGEGDNLMAIKNFHAAEKRYSGEELTTTLNDLGVAYLDVGFFDKAKYYYNKALEISEDTIDYLVKLSWAEFSNAEFQSALVLREELWERYPNNKEHILPTMIQVFSFASQHEKACKYAKEYINAWESGDYLLLVQSHRIGYALWMGGNQEESNYYFDKQIKIGLESIELGRYLSARKAAHYDLAAVYSFQGEKSKAYEYLREVTERQTFPLWWRMFFKHDPLLENIRNEPEFQQITKDIEAKYQAEHERVRQWLEDNDML